jgi:uncharacterized protein YkwD
MFGYLKHFFLPNHSNNLRPKILHHKSLISAIVFILFLSLLTFTVRRTAPSVLGIATNINAADLLSITNQKRQEQGLAPLALSDTLSKVASAKAKNMFDKDYWAHNAPDGTTPWVFYQRANYNYLYAGENLAKDFNDSKGVVDAWMASPSHRENMLSNRYAEVGFAVVNGTLNGLETTLVVEELGKRQGEVAAIPVQAAQSQAAPHPSVPQDSQVGNAYGENLIAGFVSKPLIDSSFFTKRVAQSILGIIILAFILDMVYIERRKIMRLVGHNIDHIIFLVGAILLIILFGRGVIL